jgi:3-methyladenine DNA glycosylase AlkD
MKTILEEIRSELCKHADEVVRISGEGFFKEGVKLYGIRNAVVHRMSREFFKKLTDKSKAAVFDLCDDLWRSGYNEEAFIACNWSYAVRKQFEEKDILIFEKWIGNYVTNWATCDTFCNHTVGEPMMKLNSWIGNLREWTRLENRWMKRAAAVSLIIPARRGLFLNDIFTIAENLLSDDDDMVQKGYGWMLKAASEAHQKEVFDFVMKHKSEMPRTSLRYAIEKMPADMRAKAMKK